MRISYRFKAFLFQSLRLFPKTVHDFISTRLTKSGFRTVDRSLIDLYDTHLKAISSYSQRDQLRLLEFGAGRDLLSNLYLSAQGVKNQVTVDIEAHVKSAYLNHILEQQSSLMQRDDGVSLSGFTSQFREELKQIGITYIAPCDMRNMSDDDGTFDTVISTSVLEHIPVIDIHGIMKEVKRLVRKGGIISFIIDYQDHYSYSDPLSLSAYNFLGFSKSCWKFYSPPRNYQNRLRHHQYVEIFKQHGFELLSVIAGRPDDWEEALNTVQLANCFSMMSREQLSWQVGRFILRNP